MSDSCFGVDVSAEGRAVSAALTAVWVMQHGKPPGDLHKDLELLVPLFGPHAQGTRARTLTQALAPLPGGMPDVPDRLLLQLGSDRALVTPEGRAVIEFVEDEELTSGAELTAEIALFYGRQSHSWLRKATRGGDVRPLTIGFLLFMMINGNVGPEKALVIPNDKSDQSDLANSVLGTADAFAVGLGNKPLAPAQREQLRSSWVVSEAHRQMGGYITRGPARAANSRMWLEPGKTNDLLVEIRAVIDRRRPRIMAPQVAIAFDDAAARYAESRALLAAWGMAFSDRTQTAFIRDVLLADDPAPR